MYYSKLYNLHPQSAVSMSAEKKIDFYNTRRSGSNANIKQVKQRRTR